MTRTGSATGAAILAALAGLAVAAVALSGPTEARLDSYASFGEVLVHGLAAEPRDVSYRMPLATIAAARLQYHSGLSPAALAAIHQVLLVVLVFALAGLLHPWGAAIAAAAVLILMRDLRFDLYPEAGYRPLFLLTACVLVWRARAPTAGRTVLLALSVGATMLYRTPLAFFPPLLALYEWAFDHRFSLRSYRRQLLILCVVPYLLLLPWAAMNRAVHGRLILFEKDAAAANIVTGALGLVRSVEGDLSTLVGKPVDPGSTGEVVAWAAGEIARHPLRYASACAARAAFAVSRYPVLFVLACLSAYYFRRRREHRQLALLAGYFVAVHCLMSVEPVYFEPLEPVFAVTACALAFGYRRPEEPREDSPDYRLSAALARGALALAVALGLHSAWVVGAFAARARTQPRDAARELDLALAEHPGDAWLRHRRGSRRLAAGDLPGAVEDLSAAFAAAPGDGAVALRLAYARALSGDSAPLTAWTPPSGGGDPLGLGLDAEILKACASIREGRTAKAEAHLRTARDLYSARNILVRGPHGDREREVLGKLRSSETGFARHCAALQGDRPEAERRALEALLLRLPP